MLTLNRNFHLADLVTIMNGVCGAFSIFSSARYLVTKDPNYLWTALWLPLAGCMFDLFDGKIARWRKASSMLGQELDSLADLVRTPSPDVIFHSSACLLDILRGRAYRFSLRNWVADVVGHRRPDRFRLLRSRTTREVQRHRRPHPKKCFGKVKLLRGASHPLFPLPRRHVISLAVDGMDGRHSRNPAGSGYSLRKIGWGWRHARR